MDRNLLAKQIKPALTLKAEAKNKFAEIINAGKNIALDDVDTIIESLSGGDMSPERLSGVTEAVLFAFNEALEENDKAEQNDVNLDENIETHEQLNPSLFDEDKKLLPEIKEALLKIVDKFKELLDVNNIDISIKDIVLTGSNANYNYTKDSDIDLHVIAEINNSEKTLEDLYHALYDAYRSLFSKKFNITIKDIPVEIYVETDSTPVTSGGIYSLTQDNWLKEPIVADIPEIDWDEFDKIYCKWERKCEEIIHADFGRIVSEETIDNLLREIYELRHEGLKSGGEFSIGNLVFKELRNNGYLDLLKQQRDEATSRELSVESMTHNTGLEESTENARRTMEEKNRALTIWLSRLTGRQVRVNNTNTKFEISNIPQPEAEQLKRRLGIDSSILDMSISKTGRYDWSKFNQQTLGMGVPLVNLSGTLKA